MTEISSPDLVREVPSGRRKKRDKKGPVDLEERLSLAIAEGREFLFSIQREEGHWCGELESNSTITSEYVLLCQILGLRADMEEYGPRIRRFLLRNQNADGSWGVAHGVDGDVSTTAETYLALRILGLDDEHESLARAENFILRRGGLEKLRVFTRIFFALFGLVPWESIPAIPPELMLIPPAWPASVFSLSSWARGTMIPLFVICHHRPVFALPNGKTEENNWLDHLWLDPADKRVPYTEPWIQSLFKGSPRKLFLGAADWALKAYEKFRVKILREIAIAECTDYVVTRQEKSGDWAGIFPPMLNGVLALTLEGHGMDSDPVRRGLEAIRRFAWEDEAGLRIQACVSPIWDTVLATIGLVDSGVVASDPRLDRAMKWVLERQLLVNHGDWKELRPELPSGGWSFEYFNSWYPDIDDTAAVVLALLKQDPASARGEPVKRAVRWMLGMQNRDGGWGAFDVDNDKQFLNDIPFSDMESLCDPSSPDVTGRVIEALGLLLEHSQELEGEVLPARARAIAYLRDAQEVQGSWFGRWGVNYIYGTSNVLCGLVRSGVEGTDPMVSRALEWLKLVQNLDGGFGESLSSYADKRFMGRGESTASQTAWGLLGLLAYESPRHPPVRAAAEWLLRHQVTARPTPALEGGVPIPEARGRTWDERQFTGTGFPNHFYLRYHLYRHYFPMMALGRFARGLEN